MNGHGGARAGAGQKKKATVDYQGSMIALIRDRVTAQDWGMIVDVAISHAKAGRADARDWLSSWVVGAAPKEVTVKGDGDHPVVFVVE